MITIWLINRQRPLLTVEDPELIEIFQYLNPTSQPVCADAIKNRVMELYVLGRQELRVSTTFIMKCPFSFTHTYNVIGILRYYQVQNFLYIRSLDISQ
jgi:hypothetical protein